MKKRNRVSLAILVHLIIFISIAFGFKFYFMKPININSIEAIDDYKTYKVSLDTHIVLDAKSINSIGVKNSKGDNIPVVVSINDSSKNLIIKPVKAYALGEKYVLSIRDSLQGRYFGKLKNPMENDFKIDKLPIDKSLGIGKYMTKFINNDRDYDWYVDQANTGEYSDTNCGPASAEMLGKWFSKEFKGTAADARKKHFGEKSGWFTEDIQNYLNGLSVKNHMINDVSKEKINTYLENGNIMVIGINLKYLTYNSDYNKNHLNKYAIGDGGHFIIIKGYVVADGIQYYDVYDPNSWGTTYSDGSLIGKDRYYKADEVVESSIKWYNKLLLITK